MTPETWLGFYGATLMRLSVDFDVIEDLQRFHDLDRSFMVKQSPWGQARKDHLEMVSRAIQASSEFRALVKTVSAENVRNG